MHVHLPSFPTRRSSDLNTAARAPERPRCEQRDAMAGPDNPQPQSLSAGCDQCPRAARLLGDIDRILRKGIRSEEHTSELQSRFDLVCRLLLAKKNTGTS